ncbi:hypothetical protein BCR33DRAFT_717434 [Rhizoclosmatium globosum]|uniref:MFS general substrate transporter n=1 Tax=Rhizoclosmatium globosum TaxID=329046 RepID=A0A1Y2C9S9_9FUNG|nr:hypothetical protein BCR33DRAFT_717434 [Rhizoclosmatium globosum]|eukprot:ORY43791.1 hypothetical protein BCR33DRAFT_717434 [Rhizoclosmatium globosum]
MACAGTLYLFSAYAQGLKQKRGLSQTALNGIASCGGFGQYLSGPGLLLLTGYLSLAWGYSSASFPDWALGLAYGCVGLGNSGVFNSALATTVKNFDQREHGFAVGVPLQRFFIVMGPDGTQTVDIFGFLLFVGIVTGSVTTIGAGYLHDCSAALRRRALRELSTASTEALPPPNTELSQLLDVPPPPLAPTEPSLFSQRDAWLLFGAFILLSGTGLMYINNVGAIVIALSSAKTIPSDIQATQRLHVSLLSICNCAGRISTGLASDILMTRFKLTRLVGMLAGGLLIVLALSTALFTLTGDAVTGLIPVTLLLGMGYGGIFSAAPAIVSLGPALGGHLCNLVFGMYLDSARGGKSECRGTKCFASAFKATLFGCMASICVLLVLNAMRGGFKVRRPTDV